MPGWGSLKGLQLERIRHVSSRMRQAPGRRLAYGGHTKETDMQIETKHLATVIEQHTQDMSGRVVAITGTTSGTGYVCARELAKLGATVLLLNRESKRATAALAGLLKEVPGGRFEAIACDLQDFASVRAAAEAIKAKYERLDVLCNNAGVMALPDEATKDGYDVQMQTNSISPFLLTKELFPLLRKSDDGRIVNHTSAARMGPPHEAKYFGKNGGDLGGDGSAAENAAFSGPRWARYHQSKLANCTFTYGLQARFDDKGITSVKALIAHPGLASTGLQVTTAETGGMDLGGGFMAQAQSAEDGALGILRACADPDAKAGDFFGPEGWTGLAVKLPPEDLLRDPENVRVNWEGCEAAVGAFSVGGEEEQAFARRTAVNARVVDGGGVVQAAGKSSSVRDGAWARMSGSGSARKPRCSRIFFARAAESVQSHARRGRGAQAPVRHRRRRCRRAQRRSPPHRPPRRAHAGLLQPAQGRRSLGQPPPRPRRRVPELAAATLPERLQPLKLAAIARARAVLGEDMLLMPVGFGGKKLR